MSKTCTDDLALYGDSCYIMYVYHGHLKIRRGIINKYGSFTPDDKPNTKLCQLPFSFYGDNWEKFAVYNKYQYGKVLFRNKKDIPIWKVFFKDLYLSKIKENNTGYKKYLWTNLVEEIKNE